MDLDHFHRFVLDTCQIQNISFHFVGFGLYKTFNGFINNLHTWDDEKRMRQTNVLFLKRNFYIALILKCVYVWCIGDLVHVCKRTLVSVQYKNFCGIL